jgi:butyrate kinase
MGFKILAINPGSTSTKIALFDDAAQVFKTNIEHPNSELDKYKKIADQYEMRYDAILSVLKDNNLDVKKLDAVVGRGGLLPPVKSGAYRVNGLMVERLKNNPVVEHASNLGAIISFAMAEPLKIPAFIYDSVAVDEMEPIAKITGIAEIKRSSFAHALNMRAVAIKTAKEMGKELTDLNLITTHLGGGISVCALKKGKMVDIVSDDEGPFSPERSGRIPAKEMMNLCYREDKSVVSKKLRGKGGLVSLLGTNSALEVEKMIADGDEHAKLVYSAMAYQIAKGIGEMATVLDGEVDRIIVTGGIAYSKFITSAIEKSVKFIAPVVIVPGENEMEALSQGAIRVLKGEEEANEYTEA